MLCHPRAFLFQLDWLPTLANGAEARQTLERLREGLRFFQRSGSLVKPDAGTPSVSINSDDTGKLRSAPKFTNNVHSIRDRWNELTNLVLSTETQTQKNSRRTPKSESYGKGAQVALAPRSLQFLTYRSIEFYNPYIRDKMERQPHRSADIVARFVKQRDSARLYPYEHRLAMAYFLGASEYWDLAARYCDLALDTRDKTVRVPRHEAHYLLAVCKRFQDPRFERLRESLQHLQHAQKIKDEAGGGRGASDPRYLVERVAVMLGLLENPEACDDPTAPRLADALAVAQHAEASLPQDSRLRVLLYNNLCYHFLDEPCVDLERAAQYAKQLEHTLSHLEPQPSLWPPSIVDTVVWAKFRLNPEQGLKELQSLLQQLSRALSQPGLQERHLGAMRMHRDAIQATIDKRR